jgi:negative regulator of sigma-B (phosphoserine phosphatase)
MNAAKHFSYGVKEAALQGETDSGDHYIIKQSLNDSVLIGIVDGVGHGKEAANAAQKAISILNQWQNESLAELMEKCHAELMETRGAAITLAFLQKDYQVMWLGVGNVAAVHWKHNQDNTSQVEELFTRGGIVGLELPPLQMSKFVAEPGDLLIIATDGISNQFMDLAPMYHVIPQTIAEHIFSEFRNPNDDSLVFVLRWEVS